VTVSRAFGYDGGGQALAKPASVEGPHPAVVSAVKEDIRQTLRSAWLDPSLEVAAEYPVFFTAAWSAIRPNVGKSFLALARSIRSEAVEAVRSFSPFDLRKGMDGLLSDEVLQRIEDCARAAHLGAARAQIVAHAMYRAARRERISGTGGEEPPIRRGVPEWQRWMSVQPASGRAEAVLAEATATLGLPSAPVPLRLLARWPDALDICWAEIRPNWGTARWNLAAARLRRLVLAGISTLPHPVELQWGALQARGFTEDQRLELVDKLAAFEAMMSGQTLAAAFAWAALGAPDVGGEG
jgi:hypothetical protein